MGQIAYTIELAATAASVETADIAAAIQEGNLKARKVGLNPLILRSDLQTWLETLPEFL